MLPGRPGLPDAAAAWRRGGPGSRAWREHPDPVDPTAEVGRYRDVRGGGDDAAADSGSRASAASVSPKACWVLLAQRCGRRGVAMVGDLRRRISAARGIVVCRARRGGAAHSRPSGESGSNAAHGVVGVAWSSRRELRRPGRRRACAEWFRLSPANGRPPALDGVREHHRRAGAIGIGLVEGPLELAEVVAAEVGRGCAAVRRRRRRRRPRKVVALGRPAAPSRSRPAAPRRAADQDLVFLVAPCRRCARRRASPPGRANRSWSLRPYFASMACQPAAANMPSTLTDADPGMTRSRLWRLRSTIIVTLPSSPRPSSRTASQTVPFVQLRVTDERHEPARRLARDRLARSAAAGSDRREPRTSAPPRQARPSRSRSRRGRDPSSADGYDWSPPNARSRVSIEASRLPSRYWSDVVGRRCVRLDGDEVTGPQPVEVERGQDGYDRRARRLVATDLDPVDARPNVVGFVDHPDREPEDPIGDRVEGRRRRRVRPFAAGRSRGASRANLVGDRHFGSSPSCCRTHR